MEKLVFIASNTNQVRMWKSISDELNELESGISVIICSLDLYYNQIDNREIHSVNHKVIQIPRILSKVAYWNCNLLEKILMYFEARWHTHKFFENYSPNLIVLGNDIGLLEQVLLEESRCRKIPSLLVQDGILKDPQVRNISIFGKIQSIVRKIIYYSPNSIYGLGGATKIAVMGPYSRNLFEKLGVDSNIIIETGHPRFDTLFKIRTEHTERRRFKLKGRLSEKNNLPIICFISQPMIRYHYLDEKKWDRIVRDIIFVINKLESKFQHIIKLHPSEKKQDFIDRYSDVLRDKNLMIFHTEEISDLLPVIDIVVVYNSTVSLEAMTLDKTVIIYDPYEFRDSFHFVEMSGALTASTRSELESVILESHSIKKKLQDSLGRKKTVEYHTGVIDGQSSYRIAGLIISMVRTKE